MTYRDKTNEAVKRLNALHEKYGINEDIIKNFEDGKLFISSEGANKNVVDVSILPEDSHLMDLVHKFEKETNSVVYHVINTSDVLFSLLFVSRNKEDWPEERPDGDFVFAAVYDLSGQFMPEGYWEAGDCVFEGADGGMRRIS